MTQSLLDPDKAKALVAFASISKNGWARWKGSPHMLTRLRQAGILETRAGFRGDEAFITPLGLELMPTALTLAQAGRAP